jgi:hypothetical protein
MKPQAQNLTFLNPLTCQAAPFPGRQTIVRYWLGAAMRWPYLPQGLALLLVLGMVLVFHAVVTQSVSQGVLLQQARLAQSQALQRCAQLPRATQRQACRLEANALLGKNV